MFNRTHLGLGNALDGDEDGREGEEVVLAGLALRGLHLPLARTSRRARLPAPLLLLLPFPARALALRAETSLQGSCDRCQTPAGLDNAN
eukprot:65866-Pyramimonas_sp.AAC.2